MAHHPIERAKERYGLDLKSTDLPLIAKQAREKGMIYRTDPTIGGVSVVLRWQGQILCIAMTPDQQWITTFLPPDDMRAGKLQERWNAAKTGKQKRRKAKFRETRRKIRQRDRVL